MQLKDFSLLKEYDDSYEIGHPKGKSFKVPKAGLSEKAHAEIKKMSAGGDPGEDDESDSSDENSDADRSPARTDEDYKNDKDFTRPAGDKSKAGKGDLKHTPKPPSDILNQTATLLQKYAAPQPAQAPAAAPDAASPGAPAQGGQFNPQIQYQSSLNAPLQDVLGAEKNIGEAKSSEESQMAGYQKDLAARMAALPDPMALFDKFNKFNDEMTAKYLSGKIDPNHYWADKSTGSRILSSIALMAGGVGSGLTGQPNPALEFINKAIDRDLDAQKSNQSNAINLVNMNRAAFGNNIAALTAAKSQALELANAQMEMAKHNASSVIEKNNIAKNQAPIKQQIAMNNLKLSIFSHLGAGQSSSTPSPMDPAQALQFIIDDPEDRKRATEEIAKAQEVKSLYGTTEQAARHIEGMAGKGVVNPADYNATRNAFMGELLKLEGVRANPDNAEHLASALLPGVTKNVFQDGEATIAHKRELRKQFFQNLLNGTGQTMDRYNLPLSAFDSTSIPSVLIAPPAQMTKGSQGLTGDKLKAYQWATNPKSKNWDKGKASQILKVLGRQ